jgi:hypothetical protein
VFLCLISIPFVALYEARVTLECGRYHCAEKAHGTDDAENHQEKSNSRPLDILYWDCCFFPHQAFRRIVPPSRSSAFTHAALTISPSRLFVISGHLWPTMQYEDVNSRSHCVHGLCECPFTKRAESRKRRDREVAEAVTKTLFFFFVNSCLN